MMVDPGVTPPPPPAPGATPSPHARTLLVTNDFPPRLGGIQTYLQSYVERLDPDQIVVYCSTFRRGDPGGECAAFDRAQPYRVVRYPGTMMLPTRGVRDEMMDLIRTHNIETVWFGAAAPLGLLAPAARAAGAKRILATTHGHEVGWAMLPGGRQLLRRIFTAADVVSFISDYTRKRLRSTLAATPVVRLPGGIDTHLFRPDWDTRAAVRARLGIGDKPLVLCLSRLVRRKGQDQLIKVWPEVVAHHPDAHLVIAGDGPYRRHLEALAAASPARDRIILTGAIEAADLPRFQCAADLFAMPARTRFGGLDVEGLGIVYLEAQACGVPVIAGRSGGAPETVLEGETGWVVNGWSRRALRDALIVALNDPRRLHRMGVAARAWARRAWNWPTLTGRARRALTPGFDFPAANSPDHTV